MYQKIRLNPTSNLWRRLAIIFTQMANLVPLYFSKKNIVDIYEKRAKISEFVLRLSGFETDILIPAYSRSHEKIRLGIYADTIAPYTKIYATLPIF